MSESTMTGPVTTGSTVKHYYDALADGRLVADRCRSCATITFPATGCCESCGSYDREEVELSGRGTLLFASHNTAPACHPRFNPYAPYVYGHVMLEEGIPAQGIIQGPAGTPEVIRELFERGPVPVVLDVLQTEDLPVIAFRLVA
jgi:uncharacterized OB-fold protein